MRAKDLLPGVVVLAILAAVLPLSANADMPRTTTTTTTTTTVKVIPLPDMPVNPGAQAVPAPQPQESPLPNPDAQMIQMVQSLNQGNPFFAHSPSAAASITPGSVQPAGLNSENLGPQLAMLQGLLQNKWFQKYIHIFSDPDLQRDALTLIQNPSRMQLLYWELGWIVFMLAFKAWRMMKAKGFVQVVFTQFWTFCLFLMGMLVIPHFVFGPPYLQFIHSFVHAVRA